MNKRLGKIMISESILNENIFSKVLFMIGFIPHRVEYLYSPQQFEYIGTSPLFDELEESTKIPEYKITIQTNNDGNLINVALEKI